MQPRDITPNDQTPATGPAAPSGSTQSSTAPSGPTPPNGARPPGSELPKYHANAWLTRLTLAPLRIAPWYKLPAFLGAVTLLGVRNVLREQNLHDTTAVELVQPEVAPPADHRYLHARTIDGSYNDLASPRIGAAGSRFGRNVPLAFTYPEAEPGILEPNPRIISRELMTRSTFLPAAATPRAS